MSRAETAVTAGPRLATDLTLGEHGAYASARYIQHDSKTWLFEQEEPSLHPGLA